MFSGHRRTKMQSKGVPAESLKKKRKHIDSLHDKSLPCQCHRKPATAHLPAVGSRAEPVGGCRAWGPTAG